MPEKEMNADEIRGAIKALDGFADSLLPITTPDEGWIYNEARQSADSYRAQLAALPPQPDLRAALVEARAALAGIEIVAGNWRTQYQAWPLLRAAIARIDAALEVKP